jgi:hypothetical protein
MTNIIGLTLAETLPENMLKVFVNADNITHWCRQYKDAHTIVYMNSGKEVLVRELPGEILARIEPEPDYEEVSDEDAELVAVQHFLNRGELLPGERITFHTFLHYADGSVYDFITEATLDETRDSDGTMYHYFRDGEGVAITTGRFGWPVSQFQSEDSE